MYSTHNDAYVHTCRWVGYDNYTLISKQNTFIFYHFEVQKYKTHKMTKLLKLELYKFFTHVVSIFTANSCSIKQTLIKLESPVP